MVNRCLEGRESRNESHGRDRGQVILIGAITLAFIILGLVVVVNGVLYTQTMASGSSGQSGTEAATIDGELEQGIGGIAHHGNLEWDESRRGSYDEYNDTLEEVVEDQGFRERYRNVTANSRPAAVNVTIEGVDPDDRARARTGEPVSSSPTFSNRRVGHLAFHVTSNNDGTITVNNGSDTVEINEASVDGSPGFVITDADGDTCEVANESARINLVTGAVNVTTSDRCDRRFLDPSDPAALTIGSDGGAEGTYDLVVRQDAPLSGLLDSGERAAWAVDVIVTYESNDVSYERSQRVAVYGDDS